jgi:Uma2 family endonuclease
MGYGPVRFTFADAVGMVERGILPEDATVELLDGSLVYRDRFDLKGDEVVEGFKHNYVITALGQLASRLDDERRHLRTQSTLKCSDTHAPIPDGVVLRGTLSDYTDIPTAADAYCVIEVADSSYERDAGDKLEGYARAGVPQYVIVNLRTRKAEVFANPDPASGTYAAPQVVAEGEPLLLGVGPGESFTIRLADILPKPIAPLSL